MLVICCKNIGRVYAFSKREHIACYFKPVTYPGCFSCIDPPSLSLWSASNTLYDLIFCNWTMTVGSVRLDASQFPYSWGWLPWRHWDGPEKTMSSRRKVWVLHFLIQRFILPLHLWSSKSFHSASIIFMIYSFRRIWVLYESGEVQLDTFGRKIPKGPTRSSPPYCLLCALLPPKPQVCVHTPPSFQELQRFALGTSGESA